MAKTPAWQRKEGKSKSGGLNEAGRRSLRRQNRLRSLQKQQQDVNHFVSA